MSLLAVWQLCLLAIQIGVLAWTIRVAFRLEDRDRDDLSWYARVRDLEQWRTRIAQRRRRQPRTWLGETIDDAEEV